MFKKVLFFSMFLLFSMQNESVFAKNIKNNVNMNKKNVYKCKRPSTWNKIYVKKINCFMDTRNYLLYKNTVIDGEIEKYFNKITYCKVKDGSWLIHNGKFLYFENDIKNIDVDHIIPFDWLAKQMKDNCDYIDLVYNYELNLELVKPTYNRSKNNKICHNIYICKRQKAICQKMNKDFKEYNISFNCDEL